MPFHSENLKTLFYFYSTVPQVLGAMLAIIGAVHHFRVEDIRRLVFTASKQIVDKGNATTLTEEVHEYFQLIIDNIKSAQLEGNLIKLRTAIDQMMEFLGKVNIGSHVFFIKYQCRRTIDQLERIKNYRNIVISVFWINGTIVFLYISAFLIISRVYFVNSWYWILMGGGVSLAFFSLYTMITYIKTIVLEKEQPNLIGFKLDFRKLWNTIFEKLKRRKKKHLKHYNNS